MADNAETGRLRRAQKYRFEPNQKSVWVKAIHRTKFEGLKNAFKPNVHVFERGCWITFVTLSVWHASVLIYDSMNKFNDYPMLYVFYGRIDIEDVFFPGVTVCPLHLLLKSILKEAFKIFQFTRYGRTFEDANGVIWDNNDAGKLLHMLQYICKPGKSFGKRFTTTDEDSFEEILEIYTEWIGTNNVTLEDNPNDESYTKKILPFIKRGLVDCSKIILAVLWEDDELVVKEVWVPTQTDMGTCCSFNKIPDEVLRKDVGLMAILNAQGYTYRGQNETIKAWGDLIIDHHQFIRAAQPNFGTSIRTDMEDPPVVLNHEIPRRQKLAGQPNGLTFFLVNPVSQDDMACPVYDGSGYKIHIHSPIEEPDVRSAGILIAPDFEVLIDLSAEVTMSDKRVHGMNSVDSKCHFQKNNFLTNYFKYTEGNCRKDCVAKLLFENCNCLMLSMTNGKNQTICGSPANFACVESVLAKLKTHGYTTMCARYGTCYPGCTEIIYGVKVSYAPLSASKFKFPEAWKFNKTNGANLIHVFFGSQTITARIRQQQYDTGEKIGIIGGILGLTNGMTYSHSVHILAGLYLALFGFFDWLGWSKRWGKNEGQSGESKSKKRRKRRSRRRNRQPVVPSPRTVTQVNPANPPTRVFVHQRRLRPIDGSPRRICHL